MNSTSINAEFFRELSYIADDENYMKKALQSIRKLVAQKEKEVVENENYQPRTKKELVADFKEACTDLKLKLEGKLEFQSAEELLNEL